MNNNPFQKYHQLLKLYIRPHSIPILWKNWTDNNRHYHNIDHLNGVLHYIEKRRYRMNRREYDQLILAAFFHDAIYDSRNSKNHEEDSKKFFKESYIGEDPANLTIDAIDCTKYRKRPRKSLLKLFWNADNAGFRGPWKDFLNNEKAIRKEFSFLPEDKYIKNRISFLESNYGLFGPKGDTNIRRLIKHLQDK